jgi:hypothetical protein
MGENIAWGKTLHGVNDFFVSKVRIRSVARSNKPNTEIISVPNFPPDTHPTMQWIAKFQGTNIYKLSTYTAPGACASSLSCAISARVQVSGDMVVLTRALHTVTYGQGISSCLREYQSDRSVISIRCLVFAYSRMGGWGPGLLGESCGKVGGMGRIAGVFFFFFFSFFFLMHIA